ncbi:hypothetical protein FQN57_000312 [Myotisia sp. PD_48]|nr:hypothetical protein FQN57_000312 [Myotisia sp. PD_48]
MSEEAYETLADILLKRNTQIFEIEILPPGFGPILQDGLSLGITKRALVQAFVTARSIFFNDDTSSEALRCRQVASEIILLFDSEHLTACNWRKRRCLESKQCGTSAAEYVASLNVELALTASLLGSPLHRHTKSPVLWYHRFWVLAQVLRTSSPLALNQDVPGSLEYTRRLDSGSEILLSEVSLVLRATERHPMNYYAFSYLRQFIWHVACLLAGGSVQDEAMVHPESNSKFIRFERTGSDTDASATFMKLLAKPIIETIKQWCLSHPRDNSGWMFLLYLLSIVDEDVMRRDVVGGVIRSGFNIAWQNEALWTFVDISTTKFNLDFQHLLTANVQCQGRVPEITRPTRDSTGGWRLWAAAANLL